MNSAIHAAASTLQRSKRYPCGYGFSETRSGFHAWMEMVRIYSTSCQEVHFILLVKPWVEIRELRKGFPDPLRDYDEYM